MNYIHHQHYAIILFSNATFVFYIHAHTHKEQKPLVFFYLSVLRYKQTWKTELMLTL